MTFSGSEQVAGRIADVLDAEAIFTFAAEPEVAERAFPGREVHTSEVGRTRLARRRWPWLLPLMARWWRHLDLSPYDVVVTVSHAAVNSIRVRPGALHLSYCCTPMRYAWEWRSEMGRVPRVLRPAWPAAAAMLRASDRRRARAVHRFLAVSEHVARRIHRCYGAPAEVVYPPVDTGFFTPDAAVTREDFYLYAGRLVGYKRPEVAVRAAAEAGVRLVVAGAGPELERLRRLAGPTVTFEPYPTSGELRDLYRRARALVFPGVEDFGIVMVEAQACGTPVIAYGRGGAREAVRNGETGRLYEGASPAALARELRTFDPEVFQRDGTRRHAEPFSASRFDRELRRSLALAIERCVEERA